MARLPTAEQIGWNAPRETPGVVRAPDISPVAEAVSRMGGTVNALSLKWQGEQDDLAEERAAQNIQFRTRALKREIDQDPDHRTRVARFGEKAQGILDEEVAGLSDDNARQRLAMRAAANIQTDAFSIDDGARRTDIQSERFGLQKLIDKSRDEIADPSLTDEQRQQAMDDVHVAIGKLANRPGYLDPTDAYKVYRGYNADVLESRANRLLRDGKVDETRAIIEGATDVDPDAKDRLLQHVDTAQKAIAKKAVAQFKQDALANLAGLTPAEISARVSSLDPETYRARGEEPPLGKEEQEKLFLAGLKAQQDIEKQRIRQPAEMVDNLPELRAAKRQALDGTVDSQRRLVQTRLVVQERAGIPSEAREALTRSEAREIIGYMDYMKKDEFDARFGQLTKDVDASFGDMAPQVMKSLMRYLTKESGRQKTAANVVKSVWKGQSTDPLANDFVWPSEPVQNDVAGIDFDPFSGRGTAMSPGGFDGLTSGVFKRGTYEGQSRVVITPGSGLNSGEPATAVTPPDDPESDATDSPFSLSE